MDGCSLKECSYLEHLSGKNLTTHLNLNSFLQSIVEDAEKMIGSLYHFSGYMTLSATLYITSDRSGHGYNTNSIAVISGLALPSPHLPVLNRV